MSESKKLTYTEIRQQWDEWSKKKLINNASEEFKALFPHLVNFEDFSKMMRFAHLPNPCLSRLKKD
jgi:hypothetical protein